MEEPTAVSSFVLRIHPIKESESAKQRMKVTYVQENEEVFVYTFEELVRYLKEKTKWGSDPMRGQNI
ncbi:hypothetical protein [Bacillus taeanensis]|uniref:Uncharacterized protein n=1 Tax=Bacillus taeanensis TaxID=273032 RepID=A0A366XW30_9BACI|nr:hypothetical protein [Bacillus taeanensis]RBW68344.1 hypothetical protein DS031_16895 [Bacillus taeanensis]